MIKFIKDFFSKLACHHSWEMKERILVHEKDWDLNLGYKYLFICKKKMWKDEVDKKLLICMTNNL